MIHIFYLILFFFATSCISIEYDKPNDINGDVKNPDGLVIAFVDSYGENGVSRSTPLHFSIKNTSLADKQIIKACEEAARKQGFNIINQCANRNCFNVYISSNVGTNTHSSDAYTRDTFQFRSETRTSIQRDRVIKLLMKEGQTNKEMHISSVRSAGPTTSIAGVAREMCKAMFYDFPKHLRSIRYDVYIDSYYK